MTTSSIAQMALAKTYAAHAKIDPITALRLLCEHLTNHGRIELGTPQSAMLISATTTLGGWEPDQNGGGHVLETR